MKKYRFAVSVYVFVFLILAYLMKNIVANGSNSLQTTLIILNSVTVFTVSIVMHTRHGIDFIHTLIMVLVYLISISVVSDSAAVNYLYFYIIIDFVGIPMARILKSFQSI